MALPQTPEQWAQAAKLFAEYPARLKRQETELLGHWVSGLEPEIVWDSLHMGIAGVTAKGFPVRYRFLESPSVVISASAIPSPAIDDMDRK